MKKRSGFVSNSSSSSFIILGTDIDSYDIFEEFPLLKDGEKIYGIGYCTCEADVFEVTEDILTFVAYECMADNFAFVKAYKTFTEDQTLTKDDFQLDVPFNIIPFKRDYYYTQDLEKFKERYNKERMNG